jgi:[acyl-carrier-protein] S-malonyltransferase
LAGTVFIFPGQGSQYVGMARAAWDAYPEVREIYRVSSKLTGKDVAAISFDGPSELINESSNAQICVFVCNEAFRAAAAKMGFIPGAVSGYSLGYYNALVAAGVLAFEDALGAVVEGADITLSSGIKSGGMAAVIGLDLAEVEAACASASGAGFVWPSNINAARQILISGDKAAVGLAVAISLRKGALKAYTLGIGAPYHSPLMLEASGRLAEYLGGLKFTAPRLPVLLYTQARYIETADDARDTLGRAIAERVLWKDTIQRLVSDGYDHFVEVGPGSSLSRMVRWVTREVRTTSIDDILKGE